MDIEQEQLEKARVYAYWGFIGLIHPIIGIITSGISTSILNRLVMDENDVDGQEEHARLLSLANGARTLSIVMLIMMLIVAIAATSRVIDSINKGNAATNTYQKVIDSYKSNN